MKLTPLGSNQNELTLKDGTRVLFSYQTPVAATLPDGSRIRTDKRWSMTTSCHINQQGYRNAEQVSQDTLDALVKGA